MDSFTARIFLAGFMGLSFFCTAVLAAAVVVALTKEAEEGEHDDAMDHIRQTWEK